MKVSKTIFKSTLLATIIFWLIILCKERFYPFMILVIPLSMIPIGICCSVVILLTILPFFWNPEKSNKDNNTIFKKYFPFYSITSFSLCLYGFIKVEEIYCFWVSAFFTSLQAWIWLTKANAKIEKT